MISAVITLAAAVVALALALVWASSRVSAQLARRAQDLERIARVEIDLAQVRFERDQLALALASDRDRITALEEEIVDVLQEHQSSITPGDYRARLLRLARRWRAHEASSGGGSVPNSPATEPATNPAVPGDR